jgi:hypothetical protein
MGLELSEEQIFTFEPVPVPDVFVSGALSAQCEGPLVRLTFFSDRTDQNGCRERMIVFRAILLKTALDSIDLEVRNRHGAGERH